MREREYNEWVTAMKQYELGLYEKAMPDALPWREKLKVARDCGYDYVEISIDESDARLARLDWSREERNALLEDMEAADLPIRSMCLSGHRKYPLGSPEPAVRAKSLEIMEKAIDFACDLGIRTIQLAGYDVYYTEGSVKTRAYFLENLFKCAAMAAKAGVLLGFETMETAFMNTVKKSMVYVDAIHSPYLGVYPDIGNLYNAAGGDKKQVLTDLDAGRGHLIALHLKPTKPGVFRNLYFDDTTQQVDFEAAIEAAWRLGVRRYVTELWYLHRPDWKENIMVASRRMGAILAGQE